MGNEWARGIWTYDAVGLGHTPTNLMSAIQDFLTDPLVGWELASYSTATDVLYLRADRYTITLENDVENTGNVAITKSGADITVTGMSGGAPGVKATGSVTFTDQPSDGDWVQISDGTTAVTFEFDDGGGVSGGNVAVLIGISIDATLRNLVVAVNANAFGVTGTNADAYWHYNGDGADQHCGLRVVYNAGSVRLEVSAFLENTTRTASQASTNAAHVAYSSVDGTAPNNYLFIGGKYGLYLESGRDGVPNNLGHLAVVSWEAVPEFYSTDNEELRWTTMGAVLDLAGNLKFSEDRSYTFVDNQGSNRQFTGRLKPYIVRGTNSFNSQVIAADRRIGIGPRDNLFGVVTMPGDFLTYADGVRFTFGLLHTPRDSRYRISPLMVDQIGGPYIVTLRIGSPGPATGAYMMDVRTYRNVPKFVALDSTLLAWVNVTDAATGTVYRVGQGADGGRTFNIGIEWPSDVVTITG